MGAEILLFQVCVEPAPTAGPAHWLLLTESWPEAGVLLSLSDMVALMMFVTS